MTDVVTAARHRSVHLDVCRRCQLVWFDGDEFEAFPTTPTDEQREGSPAEREAAAVERLERDAQAGRGPPVSFGGGGPGESWKWLPALFGFPVEEDSSVAAYPWLTWGLSAVLVATFLATWSNLPAAVERFGLIPAQAWRDGAPRY